MVPADCSDKYLILMNRYKFNNWETYLGHMFTVVKMEKTDIKT